VGRGPEPGRQRTGQQREIVAAMDRQVAEAGKLLPLGNRRNDRRILRRLQQNGLHAALGIGTGQCRFAFFDDGVERVAHRIPAFCVLDRKSV